MRGGGRERERENLKSYLKSQPFEIGVEVLTVAENMGERLRYFCSGAELFAV
jgi:hypothetical protein